MSETPWPLQAFWPLPGLAVPPLQALWPLQALVPAHITCALADDATKLLAAKIETAVAIMVCFVMSAFSLEAPDRRPIRYR